MNNQTAQLLEQYFDTVFAAPDGIKELRELILTLAMQGQLVAQDPNDPPARELLKEIEAEKRRLMRAGKIKKYKQFAEIKLNGADFSRTYYISNASGASSSMKNVNRQVMSELPIPLPPLPEQNRIVAKIDQLMALCDRLDQQIDATTTKQTELLNAVMAGCHS